MPVLRDVVPAYRAAATAAGVSSIEVGDRGDELPVDPLRRVFDVDHIAEQPV